MHAALLQGRRHPMGAHPMVHPAAGEGVNFCVFAQHAHRLELCLFDATGTVEQQRLSLHGPHDGVFHGFLSGAQPGLVYGLRAHGPYEPERGHRYNPHKLLLDPCAREIVGRFERRDEHHGYVIGHPDGTRSFDVRDNAPWALKARVASPLSEAERHELARSRPRLPTPEMVLYEVHVKGFSRQLPGVPEALRGTYAGLAHPAALDHFRRLGVTTLSLLPVHYALDEAHLARMGKPNYWGYNTLGFFCIDPRWSCTPDDTAAATAEFRAMVRDLHAAGLEVVLDVVYNHTAEGDERGPTLSFRGLDHASWYRLVPDDRSRCENLTGCGNTLAAWQPRVTQFVLDSLRHWVTEMGVDGFRFDLASILGRVRDGHFDPESAFFTALRQDPVLAGVHLIAEPWDAAAGGYQVGRFPGAFLDWNDRFRDTVRAYWLQGAPGLNHRAPQEGASRGEMARRFAASNDLFHHSQRRPTASVNFVAVHDGHTLADVVSYTRKHNLANGEDNRDGRDNELSANFGVEGPTDDPAVLEARRRTQRAMLATLLLAQGTPMLCAGDEIGKTQRGNNNAYCQDGPLNWLDWARADGALCDFVARTLAVRRRHRLLRHDDWFSDPHPEADAPHLRWLNAQGMPLQPHEWHQPGQRGFVCEFRGVGEPTLLIAFNPSAEPALQCLQGSWRLELDSSDTLAPPGAAPGVEGSVLLPARSVTVYTQA